MNQFDQLHLDMPFLPLPEFSHCDRHGDIDWTLHIEENEARREFEREGRILCTLCLLEIVGVYP